MTSKIKGVKLSLRVEDIEVRSRTVDGSYGPVQSAEIIKWLDDGSCFSLAMWKRDSEGYDLRFIGSRPFVHCDGTLFWRLARFGNDYLQAIFDGDLLFEEEAEEEVEIQTSPAEDENTKIEGKPSPSEESDAYPFDTVIGFPNEEDAKEEQTKKDRRERLKEELLRSELQVGDLVYITSPILPSGSFHGKVASKGKSSFSLMDFQSGQTWACDYADWGSISRLKGEFGHPSSWTITE